MPRSRRDEDVNAIAHRISKNLLSVGEDFRALGHALQSGMNAPPARATGGRGRRRRARRALTPADRKRLKLQGEYLGLVRHLSVRNRAKVKVLRSEKGYPDAIRMARRLSKSRA